MKTETSPLPPACLLALGTAGDTCTVALRLQRNGVVSTQSAEGSPQAGRSGQMLGLVRRLCLDNGVTLAQVDVIAFDAGPGGFTALRVACGVAQGLGFALDRPLLPVSSLAAIAWQGREGERVFVAIDARMGEAYCAVFERIAQAEPRAVVLPAVLSPAAAVELFETCRPTEAVPVAALGDGFRAHPALAEWAGHHRLRIDAAASADAAAIAGVAALAWRSGRALPAAEAGPTYVRDKVALDIDEQARARSHGTRQP